jgi:UDP-N-acetylglucosamine acyltransferase
LIHNTAIVHPDAKIDNDVDIGAYSVIGAEVSIGKGTQIASHVVINGPAEIGDENKIFQFSSIGDDPQDKKYSEDDKSKLIIGNKNTIREFCTINRGTIGGGGNTQIGDENWIMAYVHIAHDCAIGNQNVFANHTTLAGHVVIGNQVTLGGFTGVHQYCKIGNNSFSAISSVVVKDVPPYITVSGNTAKPSGLNKEGLKRNGFNSDEIDFLRQAYRIVYRERLLLKDAINKLIPLSASSEYVKYFLEFIQGSERGIAR